MKKLLALLLALVCLLGLTACGETLEEPPKLRIVSTDGTVTASRGTSSWAYDNGFNWQAIESCCMHPLDYEDLVETLTTDDLTVKLEFDVEPDSVTVEECWSDAYWGSTDAESETAELTSVNDTLNVTLKPGGWVYVISASWDRENYRGGSRYVFHVICGE